MRARLEFRSSRSTWSCSRACRCRSIFSSLATKHGDRCLDEEIEFGMVLADESSSIATIGCTAEITRKIKKYHDGRMDILTEGRAVFRLVEMLTEKEYYEAMSNILPDDVTHAGRRARGASSPKRSSTASYCCSDIPGRMRQARSHAAGVPAGSASSARPEAASGTARNAQRRRPSRLSACNDCKALLPKLAQRQISRQRPGGNGHGVH